MNDSVKGRIANYMGHYIAKEVAKAFGIKLKNGSSNECVYMDQPCVIKYADSRLFSITKTMHKKIYIVF